MRMCKARRDGYGRDPREHQHIRRDQTRLREREAMVIEVKSLIHLRLPIFIKRLVSVKRKKDPGAKRGECFKEGGAQ